MEEIERVYAAADVFVLPSLSEGLSNSLLEAMASGLAVAASRVGGAAELLEAGESGLLFDPGDSAGLERELRALLREPTLAASLGAKARAVAESCGLADVARRYEGYYRGME
jgi:glycosyltransferase involved in cell wall biosynthesis